MDAFLLKRKRTSIEDHSEEESTDVKLAILASLFSGQDSSALMETLLACEGSVETACEWLTSKHAHPSPRKRQATPAYQLSLTAFSKSATNKAGENGHASTESITKRGKTLFLYDPEDVAAHTPCSILHNFLPKDVADSLLRELLEEAPTYSKDTFQLFDNVVTSPHTTCFYVDMAEEAERQKTEFVYNGSFLTDVRKSLPEMRKVSALVRAAVNEEIQKRIKSHYPGQKKLRYQSPLEWMPNASFVNCYDGGKESVGYHSDQLTYLGPRAIIGSLSLGVAREFRVRKVVPKNTKFDPNDATARRANDVRADTEGQISIMLPSNSLLVMHAEMQEEWKHSIAPAKTIEPHPTAGNKRLNITYRWYKDSMHPRFTPKCRCDVPAVLRCVQKQKDSRGRYMWMCHAGYTPEKSGCSFFQWAIFDDNGEPPWSPTYVGPEANPAGESRQHNSPES